MFSADLIDENVWLGNIDASENKLALDALSITHILTVLDYEPSFGPDKKRIIKYVKADDMEQFDLLSEFDSCYEFIDNAVKNNFKVLIHCHAGMSRSATIAAMYLMKKYNLTHHEAIRRLSERRRCVSPNDGFLSQLQLFYHMNYRLDKTHSLYREFQLERLRMDYIDYDPTVQAEEKQTTLKKFRDYFPINKEKQSLTEVEYKCKKCRTILFTDKDLVYHRPGSGKFDWFTKMSSYKQKQNELDAAKTDTNVCQQELFTSYLDWLLDVFSANDGDIECLKCKTKVGRYSLVGEKCTCAKWVSPAFHFHRGKIDQHQARNNDLEKLLLQRTPQQNHTITVVEKPLEVDIIQRTEVNEDINTNSAI
ncbi:unnamed protein product [Didymodactylos carnosus]|uniref:Protein-tyrosine-phosphatase n=1 Tax=Didymodactylos carnosus TaxID=1234261 RepID=A0A814C0W9_9BILA|nr:unnamed protein product [Didymodactylos carnosus]CAF1099980.1 unnamed protein product [Didymodactylos carnosus]CAF3711141.1 unnamed protein product [Didymodactylos carnosus]CAF3861433.1 unnamed protein product [Didymodactylos carnosus]